MKPEVGGFLSKARKSLLEAQAVIGINLTEAAGRAAYFAAYHTAQALIFERSGKVAKTHSGVRSQPKGMKSPSINAELHRHDRDAYNESKSVFITEVLSRS